MNAALMRATVNLAARCSVTPPPTTEEANEIAEEIAKLYNLPEEDKQQLLSCAAAFTDHVTRATLDLLEWCVEQELPFTDEAVDAVAEKTAACYGLSPAQAAGLFRAARSFAATARRLGSWVDWYDYEVVRRTMLLDAAAFV